VSRVAVSLGGGGHKPAAGAKLKAESIREAVERVKQAVEKSADS
jgi:nanoRNase/pAp phosphatase (c-di-AMP/oligoRNAs hydrolase)